MIDIEGLYSSIVNCTSQRDVAHKDSVTRVKKSILYKEPTRCNFGNVVYYSLQDYSTYFGRFLRPSSGVLKTVVAATGACHGSG